MIWPNTKLVREKQCSSWWDLSQLRIQETLCLQVFQISILHVHCTLEYRKLSLSLSLTAWAQNTFTKQSRSISVFATQQCISFQQIFHRLLKPKGFTVTFDNISRNLSCFQWSIEVKETFSLAGASNRCDTSCRTPDTLLNDWKIPCNIEWSSCNLSRNVLGHCKVCYIGQLVSLSHCETSCTVKNLNSVIAPLTFKVYLVIARWVLWIVNKSKVVQRCLYSYWQRYSSSQWSKCCGLTRQSLVSPQQKVGSK